MRAYAIRPYKGAYAIARSPLYRPDGGGGTRMRAYAIRPYKADQILMTHCV